MSNRSKFVPPHFCVFSILHSYPFVSFGLMFVSQKVLENIITCTSGTIQVQKKENIVLLKEMKRKVNR